MHEDTPDSRLSRRKLEKLTDTLTDRDLSILITLGDCRYATTGQIIRLYFTDGASPVASARTANRALSKLQKHGLISALSRRIGGVRAGSSGFVWSLTNPGVRLLNLGGDEDGDDRLSGRRRRFDPSPRFVEHTLAITELYVQLSNIKGIALTTAHFEPRCWRGRLKPDFFAVTSNGDYEDHWFLEIDLATEALSRVIQKCEQYEAYYCTGAEQMFPLVVWIVPDRKRRDSLEKQLYQSKTIKYRSLFTFITPKELEALIRKGAVL